MLNNNSYKKLISLHTLGYDKIESITLWAVHWPFKIYLLYFYFPFHFFSNSLFLLHFHQLCLIILRHLFISHEIFKACWWISIQTGCARYDWSTMIISRPWLVHRHTFYVNGRKQRSHCILIPMRKCYSLYLNFLTTLRQRQMIIGDWEFPQTTLLFHINKFLCELCNKFCGWMI